MPPERVLEHIPTLHALWCRPLVFDGLALHSNSRVAEKARPFHLPGAPTRSGRTGHRISTRAVPMKAGNDVPETINSLNSPPPSKSCGEVGSPRPDTFRQAPPPIGMPLGQDTDVFAPYKRKIATLRGCLPSGLGKSSSGAKSSTDRTSRPAFAAHLRGAVTADDGPVASPPMPIPMLI